MIRLSHLLKVFFGTVAITSLIGCDSTQLASNLAESDPSVSPESLSWYSAACDSIEVDVSGTHLLGHTDTVVTTPDIMLETPIPKGEYRIRLHYQDNSHPDQADQNHEQWYAELLNLSGNTVLRTPESADLPSDEIVSYSDVGVHVITEDVYKVRAVHAYQTDEYNSVSPLMVELYPNCDTTDRVPPVISLVGDLRLVVGLNQNYIEPGATAFDHVDGDLSGSIVIGGDTVDTAVFGSYIVTYDVRDSSGNTALRLSRTVVVTLGDEGTFSEEGL